MHIRKTHKFPALLFMATAVVLSLPMAASAAKTLPDPNGAVGKSLHPQLEASCVRNNVCNDAPIFFNGEAWVAGGLMWRTDFNDNLLLLVDTDDSCHVLQRCIAPGAVAPSELTYQNGVLYHYDFGTGLIYAIDPSSCQVLSSCNPPGDDLAEGLTSDDTYLYKGDSANIYKFLYTAAGGCQEVARCPNPVGDSADGLTFCNGQLVMLGYSGTMYRIDFNNCQVTGTCQLNLGADGNGITSDEVNRLWADNVNGDLDKVDVGCQIPIPVQPSTWSNIKTRFAD